MGDAAGAGLLLPAPSSRHPDPPNRCRSTGEQPKGTCRKRGGGGRAAWNLAIFDRKELEAAKGRKGSFPHFPAALLPA